MTDALVLSLGDPRCRMVSLSGGKGASIATMLQEGLAVPPGFVVTSAAFMAGVDNDPLRALCRSGNMAGARQIIAAAIPPAASVAEHYAVLKDPVAVRSSACAEDSEIGKLRRPTGDVSQRQRPRYLAKKNRRVLVVILHRPRRLLPCGKRLS